MKRVISIKPLDRMKMLNCLIWYYGVLVLSKGCCGLKPGDFFFPINYAELPTTQSSQLSILMV